MKKLLILTAALCFTGCQDDGATLDFNITPSVINVKDTGYLAGSIDATSPITQNDIFVTFTDSENRNVACFTMLPKDSVHSEKFFFDKNNYKLAFTVDSETEAGIYNAQLTVNVGNESPSASSSFTVVIPADTTVDTTTVDTATVDTTIDSKE